MTALDVTALDAKDQDSAIDTPKKTEQVLNEGEPQEEMVPEQDPTGSADERPVSQRIRFAVRQS